MQHAQGPSQERPGDVELRDEREAEIAREDDEGERGEQGDPADPWSGRAVHLARPRVVEDAEAPADGRCDRHESGGEGERNGEDEEGEVDTPHRLRRRPPIGHLAVERIDVVDEPLDGVASQHVLPGGL